MLQEECCDIYEKSPAPAAPGTAAARRRPLAFLWAEWRWSKGGFSAYILAVVYRVWLSANLIIFPFWLLIFFSFSSSLSLYISISPAAPCSHSLSPSSSPSPLPIPCPPYPSINPSTSLFLSSPLHFLSIEKEDPVIYKR